MMEMERGFDMPSYEDWVNIQYCGQGIFAVKKRQESMTKCTLCRGTGRIEFSVKERDDTGSVACRECDNGWVPDKTPAEREKDLRRLEELSKECHEIAERLKIPPPVGSIPRMPKRSSIEIERERLRDEALARLEKKFPFTGGWLDLEETGFPQTAMPSVMTPRR